MIIQILFLAFLTSNVLAQDADTKATNEPVQQFVQTSFYHGVPIDLARRYSSSNVPTLIEMLNDPKQKDSWANIIWVLGAIGDERGFNEIVRFQEQRFTEQVDASTFHALVQCNLAIGLLANRSQAALDYLLAASSPTYWQQQRLPWRYKTLKSKTDQGILMTQLAINGLPLSAKPAALTHLRALNKNYSSDEERMYFGPNVSESIERAERALEKGIRSVLHFSEDGYEH